MPHILPAGIVESVEILSRETATGRALNPEHTENVVRKLPIPPRRLLSGLWHYKPACEQNVLPDDKQ